MARRVTEFFAARAFAVAALGVSAAALSGCGGSTTADLYRDFSTRMVASGMFRTESAPADAPYTDADLARNFEKVVFEPEEQLLAYYRDRGEGPRRLSKWRGAIRYGFVGDAVRPEDALAIAEIASDLARHSGLSIGPVGADERPNFEIYVLTERARERVATSQAGSPAYERSLLKEWVDKPNPPCFGLYFTNGSSGGEIDAAAIYIKDEIEEPLRRTCFVEEFTQMLGLVFDHDDVRPSIFNDDQEFIALTDHDRALISILYDRRVAPGMTAEEVRPLLRRIIAERRRRPAS